ncbi:BRISC and BRCA1-A complex member 1 isoform X2 [Nomia melanderi]|uniref:BRISC and BRCA1-A complex member 1 isoform X2 n=1 Tax=Nomia melanderi TaxID=2448451 RepID=UPI001303F53F|nr:BRISC and BRCA1-A complex member 1-like [Nomia melanderi]XP_031845416.1 BRISC and BRCA1-A complex member 1-like [Nomia melanderi]XP_031845417.1 BRISC and BRCA1-A complex member 1-like [Nomia melanderi]XP_031845419.1 BRISC and BRCA1-A complex member 1-like [Nomia melanderi]
MNNIGSVSCFYPDDRSAYSDENNAFFRNLSGINLPEKILFVIDTVREKNCTPFKLSTGAEYMPLFMMKRVVENFVCIKSTIQRSHEYAIMTLNSQGARWICDFTSNIKSIVGHLDIIDEDTCEEDLSAYDLGQLFERIQSKVPLPPKKHTSTLLPTFVTRVILMYSRSNDIPKFLTSKKFFDNLTENWCFFIDVLYIHEPPDSKNLCEEIYAEMAMLDTANYSYILEVGKNAAKLHDNMAKLLAHPLQRPSQKDACYTIYSSLNLQKTYTNT